MILDRFEGDMAILEISVGKTIAIPKELVGNAQEGDCLKLIVDEEQTKERKEKISNLMNQLFK